jgi:hypothetical protein
VIALAGSPVSPARAGQYQSFRVAVYCVVKASERFADEATLDKIKKLFTDRGIIVAGGLRLSAGGGKAGQFATFDYEERADRDECKKAVELAARHFDTVILDDFLFFTSKSDADIAAKGSRSWTQYRLDTMREASTELVLRPARAINPKIKMIIKYPNWHEHFQGLGYDLEKQAQ